jgi:hypothetical protein
MPTNQQNTTQEPSVNPIAGIAMAVTAAVGGFIGLNTMNDAANGRPELMGNSAYVLHGVNARYMLRSDIKKNEKGKYEVTYLNGNGHIPGITFTSDDQDTLEKAILHVEREAAKLIDAQYGEFAKEYVGQPVDKRPPRLEYFLKDKRVKEEQKLFCSLADTLYHVDKKKVYRALGLPEPTN